MKTSDISVGRYYFNGKDAVREVLAIEGNPARVRYRLLAARQEQEYSSAQRAMVSVIGSESTCLLGSFAAWATAGFSIDDGQRLLLELRAHKTKLSVGESAFMENALDEAGGEITPGTMISYDHTEGRAVGGLAKKGMVVRCTGEVEVTELGAAWFRAAACARNANWPN